MSQVWMVDWLLSLGPDGRRKTIRGMIQDQRILTARHALDRAEGQLMNAFLEMDKEKVRLPASPRAQVRRVRDYADLAADLLDPYL